MNQKNNGDILTNQKKQKSSLVSSVKKAFSTINNPKDRDSDSSRDSEIAPQFSATNGFVDRGPESCKAFAASSLPVPVSPVMSTGTSTCAKLCIDDMILFIMADV